ncbi:MAG: hypothetical protein RR675_00455, partial [Oscillospiraceae bacterium]
LPLNRNYITEKLINQYKKTRFTVLVYLLAKFCAYCRNAQIQPDIPNLRVLCTRFLQKKAQLVLIVPAHLS